MSEVSTSVVISGRLSFPTLVEPREFENDGNPKFSVQVLWPKSDTALTEKVKAAIVAAFKDGQSRLWDGKKYGSINDVLKDGDESRPNDEVYAGMYYVNAKCAPDKPAKMGKKVKGDFITFNTAEVEKELYAGAYGHVAVNFYAHKKKNVATGLQSILKWKDGDRLSNVGNTSLSATFVDDAYATEDAAPEEDDGGAW